MPNVPQHLVVDLPQSEMESLLTDWVWLIGDQKRALLVAASGDVFVADATGKVFWLETGGGKFTEIASSAAEFEKALTHEANQTEWLLAPVIKQLHSAGILLAPGQCYGVTGPCLSWAERTTETTACPCLLAVTWDSRVTCTTTSKTCQRAHRSR